MYHAIKLFKSCLFKKSVSVRLVTSKTQSKNGNVIYNRLDEWGCDHEGVTR